MTSYETGAELFASFEGYFTKDREVRQQIRDVVSELELCNRQLNCNIDVIHLPKPIGERGLCVCL